MRPHTPTLNTSRAGLNVTSPPETPTTGSPTYHRKAGTGTGTGTGSKASARRGPPRSNVPSLGGVGSQFSYSRGVRPEDLSPRSSDSSDNESETSASPPQSPLSDAPEVRPGNSQSRTSRIVVEATFEIEECVDDDEDAMESDDDDRLSVLRPYGIEYPESDRSRSKSRLEREVDPQLMNSFQDLKTCFQSDDSDYDFDSDEFTRELKKLRKQKKARRMTSGSISKRTVSERGSDSDREDLQPWDTGDPGQRRIRRKVERWSLLSTPPEIIIELKEPNSDGEVVWDEHEMHEINLARELPFWTMEVDSE